MIAPRLEAPTAPPSVRRNVTAEVAVPRSAMSTLFCVARTVFWMNRPRPKPTTNSIADRSQPLVPTRMSVSRAMPAVMTPVPAMMKIL